MLEWVMLERLILFEYGFWGPRGIPDVSEAGDAGWSMGGPGKTDVRGGSVFGELCILVLIGVKERASRFMDVVTRFCCWCME